MTANTKKPAPTTTITKTVTGVTEFVEHSTDVQLAPMPVSARPYVLESGEFDNFILAKRQAAVREIEDLDNEIERLKLEIEARLQRRSDIMLIVRRADAALSLDVAPVHSPTPSPKLTVVEKDVPEEKVANE